MNRIKSIKTKLIVYFSLIFLAIFSLILGGVYLSLQTSFSELAQTVLNKKLHGDIASAELYFEKYFGDIRYENGNLLYDNDKIIGENHNMVDHISKDLDVVATVFVKSGDDYKRATTNIIKDDGKRAVGTFLGKDSAAYNPIIKGNDYFGDALILGKEYLTVYRPLKDSGEVIGILFIGVSKSEEIQIIREESTQTLLKILLIGVICVIVTLVIIYMISSRISAALIYVKNTLQKMSDFDLKIEKTDASEKFSRRKDEIGHMMLMLEKMAKNLKQMIVTITSKSKNIEENATNLAAISEQQFASSEALYDQSQSIEHNTQNTAVSVEEVTSGVEEVAASAHEVSNVSQELSEQVIKTENVITKGKNEIQTQQNMLETVSQQNNKAVKLVTNVADKADNVQEIVNTISSTAEQTNLLALNAAIEAARAGEAGKGFAVVADEIRKLAEESQSASGNIEKILKTINVYSAKANEAVQKTTDLFNDFKDISQNLVMEFDQISGNMEQVNHRVGNLTASAEEQSASAEEIARAMDVSAKSITEISDQIENMTQAVEQQETGARQVSSSAEELSALTEALEEEIGKFKL